MNLLSRGKDEIVKHINSLWVLYEENVHDLLNIYCADSSFSSEIVNHFTLTDGKEVSIKAIDCIDRKDNELLTSIILIADFTPLFAKS